MTTIVTLERVHHGFVCTHLNKYKYNCYDIYDVGEYLFSITSNYTLETLCINNTNPVKIDMYCTDGEPYLGLPEQRGDEKMTLRHTRIDVTKTLNGFFVTMGDECFIYRTEKEVLNHIVDNTLNTTKPLQSETLYQIEFSVEC